MSSHLPGPTGLYRPDSEHDACGVSFVVDMHGRRSHDLVGKGLTSLCNLDHRGATGAEPNTGDGAGILIQVPDRFLRAVLDIELPEAGSYATGIAFLPSDPTAADAACASMEKICAETGSIRKSTGAKVEAWCHGSPAQRAVEVCVDGRRRASFVR